MSFFRQFQLPACSQQALCHQTARKCQTYSLKKSDCPQCQWFDKSLSTFRNHYLTFFDENMKCVDWSLLLDPKVAEHFSLSVLHNPSFPFCLSCSIRVYNLIQRGSKNCNTQHSKSNLLAERSPASSCHFHPNSNQYLIFLNVSKNFDNSRVSFGGGGGGGGVDGRIKTSFLVTYIYQNPPLSPLRNPSALQGVSR